MSTRNVFYIVTSLCGLVTTFYAVGNLMFFLSNPSRPRTVSDKNSVLRSLFIDLFLILCFLLQHSLMVLPPIKNVFKSLGLDVISRSIYILISSILLLILTKYWQTISQITLWHFDTLNSITWTVFAGIHIFMWSVIYSGCLFMDITELLGVKQVYYKFKNLPDPIEFKSPELKQLYGHNRHPSFSALTIILWCFPVMTLDRLLLASLFTLYMYVLWKTDRSDLRYQTKQYIRKQQELIYMQ